MYDLVLIHTPSVMDFREGGMIFGPISDVIPSNQIFEMYPIGFLSILSYLRKRGFKVKILNLAYRMLTERKFNPEKRLRKIDADLFGIDFHWLVHANGVMRVSSILKEQEKNVLLGGLSSSYYHREIMELWDVDFVLRGDTTEPLIQLLLENKEDERKLGEIPNLSYRINGKTRVNPLSFVPGEIDEYYIDFKEVFKSALFRIKDYMPYRSKNFVGATLTMKGCEYNCISCGGSKFSYSLICNRKCPVLKSPEVILREIESFSILKAPIFLIGDLQIGGRKRWKRLFSLMREEGVEIPVIIEVFYPPGEEFLREASSCSPEVYIQISPESQDQEVRKFQGRGYSNNSLERFLKKASKLPFRRIDLYFMIGLAKQDFFSAMGIPKYAGRIMEEFNKKDDSKKVDCFLAPLAPYVDPGSLAFEKGMGYKILWKDLRRYCYALKQYSWKYSLNYEAKMSRDEIVRATYDGAELLIREKIKMNLIPEDSGIELIERIRKSKELMNEIDSLIEKGIEPEVPFSDFEPEISLKEELTPPSSLSIIRGLMRWRF